MGLGMTENVTLKMRVMPVCGLVYINTSVHFPSECVWFLIKTYLEMRSNKRFCIVPPV